jgi:hypothetical protein
MRSPKTLSEISEAQTKAADRARLNGSLCFEPHGLAGRKFEGEEMPFGYISTSPTPMPIFELRALLVYDQRELTALARRMASVNTLLNMVRWCVNNEGECLGDHQVLLDTARNVIAALDEDAR